MLRLGFEENRKFMNIADKAEITIKEKRIRDYLNKNNYDAMILGRKDNFAWFTDGGSSNVIVSSEIGFSIIVITKTRKYLVSQVMDGARTMCEELGGIGIEYVPLYWYEKSREEKALELANSKKAISDIPMEGVNFLPKEIYNLHYPLTNNEINKLRYLGNKTEEILTKVAMSVKPGITEHEIEAMLLYEYGKDNIQCDVLLVGSDERIFNYRHPCPSPKTVDKYVLLHSVARKWGLHANVTRSIYFGDNIPKEIQTKYDAVSQIEAAVISMCQPGISYYDILLEQKKLYKMLGYENEWKNHYPGGITGYMVCDPQLSFDRKNVTRMNEAYDWFITITGTKVEELSITTDKGQEILSVSGIWPTKEYSYNNKKFELPVIKIV